MPGNQPNQKAKGVTLTRADLPENRKILVVGTEAAFSEAVMEHAAGLAERLGYDLIALNVSPAMASPGSVFSPYRKYRREKFRAQAAQAAAALKAKLALKGVNFDHLVKFGDIGQEVESLNHEVRRIEFVINASEFAEDKLTAGLTLPVFTVKGSQGEKKMADHVKKARPYGKTVAFGLATAALYAAVFLNSGTIMTFFTKGGWYAALPIATAFMFSFVHGAFSNYFWSALGIEAPKKTVVTRPAATKRPVRRQRPRPRLELNV